MLECAVLRCRAMDRSHNLRAQVRWLAYMASRFFIRWILGLVTRTHVLHRERSTMPGGWLFIGNHITHFDPPFFTSATHRKIDWMATRELFHPWPVAIWM